MFGSSGPVGPADRGRPMRWLSRRWPLRTLLVAVALVAIGVWAEAMRRRSEVYAGWARRMMLLQRIELLQAESEQEAAAGRRGRRESCLIRATEFRRRAAYYADLKRRYERAIAC